ncbi:PQQ-binding-like beta-propeller repeat protein [Rubritalea marina]|uniref:PQQ-binding-like beta-propeller repeat protein n=1 Tax=Rubritalea marina TaxID=361055 RepID=UPI00036B2EBC|nr:PQQ-binding-like beta-propeller repeat protein [Rubritalea marina]
MKVIDEVSSCSGLKSLENALVKRIEDIVYVDDFQVREVTGVSRIYPFKNNLYFSLKSTLYEIESGSSEIHPVFRSDGYDNLYRLTDFTYLCFKRVSRDVLKYVIIDQNHNVLWGVEGDRFAQVYSDRVLLSPRFIDTEFWLHDQHGKELFHHQLPKGFSFADIKVMDDVLFIRSNKGVNEVQNLKGLDANTGELIWEKEYRLSEFSVAYNLHQGMYYGLNDRDFQILNPVTGEFVANTSVDGMFPKGVSPEVPLQSIHEGKLWFVSGRGSDACFGCFDIETQSLDFIQQQPLEGDDIFDAPVFHQGKLYLRSKFENLLYILE